MRKRVILSTLLLLTAFIILPGSGIGKDNVCKVCKPPVADGNPFPPLPPNPPNPQAILNTSVA